MSHSTLQFTGRATYREPVDLSFLLWQSPAKINLRPHPLSIAIAAIIFNVYSR
ncbi:hypothetical protein HOV23_gp030 [Pseudomonas phage Lana]|uniref:Uncharacterized protein n=1 Tax=Pseudomonas phage Lana TaxID=2530172 RepID=A0A481W6F7_9CAUD|nr:hypothetical protein HOV23_gp030 [Pseudomonas phage Lana]QBJ04543.1 hypothetical protein [Pseudomonas phage Lana]